MTALLTIEGLNVNTQGKNILSDLDLNLDEGDILGLVGASGCGKTTLLNVIAGFSKLSKGNIILDGQLLSGYVSNDNNVPSEHKQQEANIPAEERQVGMIFQDYALFPHLTVRENITFGISKLDKSEQAQQVKKLLIILKLNDYSESYIHQLSGGQQQRVAIARALAPKPKLLLLDEPFSNIDARLRSELMVEIRLLLKQFNMTAIFVTHNKDEVFTFADKMALMAHGKLLQFDEPSIICQQPNSYQVADFLQLGSWLPCKIDNVNATSLLGNFTLENTTINKQTSFVYLLVKPSQLLLNTEVNTNTIANAQVDYISVTEQGYHYYLSSLHDPIREGTAEEPSMKFSKLSLYSDIALSLKQQVFLSIKPHNYLFFNHDN